VACRRHRVRRTQRHEHALLSDDLVQRQFTTSQPDALCCADITYLPTRRGFLYPAIIIDAYSRRVVGWSIANHLRTELVLDALEMAVRNRGPGTGLTHQADHGSQYTSLAFERRCGQAGSHP
jgi:putative transposase